MSEPKSWNDALGKADLNCLWHVRGRRKSDFALIEVEHEDEALAHKQAQYLYANGYDVKVHAVAREHVAEWVHDGERD